MHLNIHVVETITFPQAKLEEGYAVRLVDTRKLTDEDREQWAQLQAHRDDIEDPTQRLLIPVHGAVTFAEFEGKTVGCFAVRKRADKIADNRHAIILHEHRRKGLFTAMAELQWRYCIDENIKVLYLSPISSYLQKLWFDLGAVRMEWPWKYTSKTEPRGTILFEAVKKLLKKDDTFLDVDCGYSPMAQQILDHGHTITGFDIDPGVIKYLKDTQPRGEWLEMDDVNANFQGHTVLLFLGVTTPLYAVYSTTYYETAERLLELNNPTVVLLESAASADQTLYNKMCQLLENTGRYVKKQDSPYDAELKRAGSRHYSVWARQWNYSYWQNLFRSAEDAELDALHERFYEVATKYLGYLIRIDNDPLEVYNPLTQKTISPVICNKDKLVKKLILEKVGAKTMLNIGFWRARFALHMGFEGFNVDGIECYRKVVKAANKQLKSLPPEIAARFNFYYGFAEHLESYPLYDIVVNHCLEHVRDPAHVMRESLKHTKPDGYTYFTPPWKTGANSPTHLHHFDEQALRNLLPEGYHATILRTKFHDGDPWENYIVMEVSRNV